MYRGYRRIFWGIFFMIFDIDIFFIPLPSSVLGGLIVMSGIGQLDKFYLSGWWKRAITAAGVLTAFNVVALLAPLNYPWSVAVFYGLHGLCEIILYYLLFSGSAEMLINMGLKEEAEQYLFKTAACVVILCGVVVIEMVAVTFFSEGLVVAAVVLGMIVRVWLMLSMGNLKRLAPELGTCEEGDIASQGVYGEK